MAQQTDLDSAQQRVVDHGPGPLCVLGAPGTGKTRVLEERFISLALSEGCSPDRILLLVSNRAQKIDLQARLTDRLLFDEGLDAVVEVPVYTWHGFANHLVSRNYDRLAYSEPPVLLTSPEHWGDVRDALAHEREEDWGPQYAHLLRNRGFVDEVVDFCIRAEQRLLEPYELAQLVELRPAWRPIVAFFRKHSENLRRRSRIDYPTLLADAAELIANHDDVRDSLHERFLHVLVDDGQELARVQQRLLRFLTGFVDRPEGHGARSLVVVADPDSAIETFRGAEPQWLDGFEKEFGPHDTVVLERSYRLGPHLGEKVSTFIGRNGDAPHRSAHHAGHTELEIRRYGNLAAEVEAAARTLRTAHLRDGVAYDDMAVLLTSPRQMLPALERALNALEVPYAVSAPDRPLEREPAVRAFCDLAHLALADEPDPDRVADLLRSPLAGLTPGQVRDLERAARAAGVTVVQVLGALPPDTDPETATKVTQIVELLRLLHAKRNAPADEAFWAAWDAAPYYGELVGRARAEDEAAHRELDALVAFARALGRFVERRRGKGTFVEYLDAISRADFGSDPWLPPERAAGGVQVLSFHAAKGKEWDVVVVAGCVEGAIPKGRRAQGLFDPYFPDEPSALDRAAANEAEDRRVFYVALTRARSKCIVSASPGPSRKGQVSRYVSELAGEMPEVEPTVETPPLTLSEAAARHRRTLADVTSTAAERLAALDAIVRICNMDPRCSAARPSEWWWRWDWTSGPISINEQRAEADRDVPPNKLRTSYSRLSEYDNCGLRYLYGVVLGLDPETSHNMAFGTWIHKIFEECDRLTLTNIDMAMARYEELFDESVFPNRAIARQFKHDGRQMIERYVQYLNPGKAVLVEREFNVEHDGHVIRGRIDRVERAGQGVKVIDYKTSRNPIHKSEAEQSLQLAIYYLAAKNDEEIAKHGPPLGMYLVYPGVMSYGKVADRFQHPDSAVKTLEKLPVLIDGILAEDFRPRADADCTWCKFKALCPLWPEGKELPA